MQVEIGCRLCTPSRDGRSEMRGPAPIPSMFPATPHAVGVASAAGLLVVAPDEERTGGAYPAGSFHKANRPVPQYCQGCPARQGARAPTDCCVYDQTYDTPPGRVDKRAGWGRSRPRACGPIDCQAELARRSDDDLASCRWLTLDYGHASAFTLQAHANGPNGSTYEDQRDWDESSLYSSASAMWCTSMSPAPSRSAMERATASVRS